MTPGTSGASGPVDVSGPCDEAEHASDPRCTGVGAIDNSGHSGSDDGVDHDQDDDRSGQGGSDDGVDHDLDDDRSGHGGSDDHDGSGGSGSDDAGDHSGQGGGDD
jgi:hypothetical protein